MKAVLLLIFVVETAVAGDIPAVYKNQVLDFRFNSSRSWYACSYAKSQAQDFLESLGAKNIEFHRCSDGRNTGGFLSMRVQFAALELTSESRVASHWTYVELGGDEACTFNNRLIQNLLPYFSIRNLESSNSCWYSQGRYRFRLETLQE